MNKLKKALEAVKRVATSERGKGLASAVGAAVINNRETISKLAKVIGVPEDKVATVDQILKVGNGFYMNDVDGGLKALAELTGHPLSEGEERAIERDMRSDEEVDYGKILALLKRKSDAVADGIDLHRDNQDSFWARYGLYVALSAVALVLVGSCACCVLCCWLCMSWKKSNSLRDSRVRYSSSLQRTADRSV